MATIPEICIEYESDASKITVTDETGAYDINNEGGYGAPNAERSSLAGVLLVYYNSYDDPKELIVDVNLTTAYDANYANTEKSEFVLDFLKDGWYEFLYVLVPTSITPAEDSIIYDTVDGALKQYNANLDLVDVFDISALDNPAIYSLNKKNDFPLPKLKTFANKKAKDYFLESEYNNSELSQDLDDILTLDRDIQTQIYYFNVSPLEAQKRIEALTKKFKL